MKWKAFIALLITGVVVFGFQNCQGDMSAIGEVESQLQSESQDISAAAVTGPKPNILMIMLDDAGQGDWLNPTLAPKIAEFKNQATLFPEFYVNPMCAPTRMSMLSGHSHVDYSILWVCGSSAIYGIPLEDKTFPEVLAEKGQYLTSAIGKWHSGKSASSLPKSAEFDIGRKFNFYQESQGVVQNGYFNPVIDNNGTLKPYEGKHLTNVTSQNVINRINYHATKTPNRPFYIQYWLNAPHGPHLPDPTYIPNTDPFKASYLQFLAENPGAVGHPFLKKNKRKLYEYLLKQGDARVGAVLDLFKNTTNPYLQNTIIMITSDNGGTKDAQPSEEPYGNIDLTYGAPRDLRGFKTDVYEGGIRQHLIVKYKNQNYARVDRSNLSALDLYPTILELTGIAADATYGNRLQGKSFASLITSQTATFVRGQPLFWAFKTKNEHLPDDENGEDITQGYDRMSFAMREGHWKFVIEPPMPDEEGHSCTPCLFYFENGYSREGEADDVFAANREQGLKMREQLLEWYLSTTQMPVETANVVGVTRTVGSIVGFKKNGPKESTVSFSFPNNTNSRYAELTENYRFDVNRLDFTFSGTLKLTVTNKEQVIASRPGTWILRVNAANKLEVVTFGKDKKTDVTMVTTSPEVFAKNVAYDIAFHVYSFKSAPSIVKIFSRNATEGLEDEERLTLQVRNPVTDGLTSNNNPLYIGTKVGTSFAGTLQNVRLYHAPLRQSDINYGMRRWGNTYD